MTEDDQNLLAVWRDIASSEDGSPALRIERKALKRLLDIIPEIPHVEVPEIPQLVPEQTVLFDNVTIEPGAIHVGDKSFPLIKFNFTSSNGQTPPTPIHFVGPPLVVDHMRRLLRDAVRAAVNHANGGR